MEGPNLTQHEVIKFLTLRGGRCTNFELVSNFRGALNHPQHQAEARLRFKDIVNTVAHVGEYQNVKFIELKKEYRENNLQPEPLSPNHSPQPSSLSSDSGSSYTSPLTQSFQPYWRYRLSTSTKVPSLPAKSHDYEICTRSHSGNTSPSHMGRSVSESTLPQRADDIHPPPRTRGRSAGSFNRSVSENPAGESSEYTAPTYRRSSLVGADLESRRSSINGYPEISLNLKDSLRVNHPGIFLQNQLSNQQSPYSTPSDSRRNSEVFASERQARTQWPSSPRRDSNRISSEYSALSHSRSFSGNHELSNPAVQGIQCNSSNNVDKFNREKLNSRNATERSPKRTGICSDEMLRELDEDNSKSYMDNPISRSFNRMHGIGSTNSEVYSKNSEDIKYSSMPECPYSYSQSNKMQNQSPSNQTSLESNPAEIINQHSEKRIEDTIVHAKPVNRNIFLDVNHREVNTETISNTGSIDISNLEYDSVSISSTNSGCKSSNSQEIEETPKSNINRTDENNIPIPPERRRKHNKPFVETSKDNNKDELPNNVGKVKDRVQLFDDLEKKRNHSKRNHSPLPDKENRNSKVETNLMEDDVSISVLDSKLKREWFVKAAQGDYYALVGLLKKEPRLAAIKDIATTALHWAAKHGDANIVKLISGTYRVNPNIRSGYTPIHLATLYKHALLVDLLVHTYGADASIRDYSGKRADQYPGNYVRSVAGLKALERRPLKARPVEKESGVSAFMRIGSLNLRKSRKSAVFASVRGSTRNWGSATELRLNSYKSARKKNSTKNVQPEKKCDTDSKNDSDSDSAYGFYSK